MKDLQDMADRMLAEALYDGFVRCPTTGRVVEVMKGDDKVMCGCGRSNPKCQAERTEMTGTHVVAFMSRATVDEYLEQLNKKRGNRRS